jgi:hypothetical protein
MARPLKASNATGASRVFESVAGSDARNPSVRDQVHAVINGVSSCASVCNYNLEKTAALPVYHYPLHML